MLIREGLIHQVRCPDLDCSAKKEDDNEPPSQEELILIVGQDLANRYDRLQLQLKLQADPSITFCPRLQCQKPVVKDKNYDKLCCCSACGYAFCLVCKYCKEMSISPHSPSTYFSNPILPGQKTWHGKQVYCQFKDTPAILQQYLDCEDDPEELRKLEGKYGKKNLEKLVNDYKIEVRFLEKMRCLMVWFVNRSDEIIQPDGDGKMEERKHRGVSYVSYTC
jgi:E3 ubiquitin-protein ligase RNF14